MFGLLGVNSAPNLASWYMNWDPTHESHFFGSKGAGCIIWSTKRPHRGSGNSFRQQSFYFGRQSSSSYFSSLTATLVVAYKYQVNTSTSRKPPSVEEGEFSLERNLESFISSTTVYAPLFHILLLPSTNSKMMLVSLHFLTAAFLLMLANPVTAMQHRQGFMRECSDWIFDSSLVAINATCRDDTGYKYRSIMHLNRCYVSVDL